MGYASTQVLDEDAVEMLVSAAKENALLIENPDRQFIHEAGDSYTPVEGIYREELDRMTERDKIEFALSMEKEALQLGAQKVTHCMVSTSSGKTLLRNSLGLELERHSNLGFACLEPILTDAGQSMQDGFAYYAGRDLDLQNYADIAKRGVEDARSYLGSESLVSGTYDILFENETMTDLIACFGDIFSADAAQRGLSLLQGKEGEPEFLGELFGDLRSRRGLFFEIRPGPFCRRAL